MSRKKTERKVRGTTERAAITRETLDDWMQRRIRYFGKPCLTSREYTAVVYSLHGLPAVAFDEKTGEAFEVEIPSQRHVTEKMEITQCRVSQLLMNAERVMSWFEDEGLGSEIEWRWKRNKWEFIAPVMDGSVRPKLEKEPRRRVSRAPERLAFAGDL